MRIIERLINVNYIIFRGILKMDEKLLNWFLKKYNFKNFDIALRDYKTKSIIKNNKRYIVKDIYPEKIDGCYFYVYKNTPVKEKILKPYALSDNPFEEYTVQLRAMR